VVVVLGELDQALQLATHDFATTDRSPHGGLVEDDPHAHLRVGLDALLSFEPGIDALLDDLVGLTAAGDDLSGVGLGLQQARDELRLVDADVVRCLLEAHIAPEPLVQRVAVLLPPTRFVGIPGDFEVVLHPGTVGDPVQLQQILDIAQFEADTAEFHPADLGSRSTNRLARGLPGDTPSFTVPTYLVAEEHTTHGGAAPRAQSSDIHVRRLSAITRTRLSVS